ncbi:hypothetical protein CIG75_05065 [Tumebacillus algifaecis]|uniref:DUF4178 domain-containing protein n=1 Tax=Tumebacillus algifaecis TaxID=1214604 RepID=A0A223CYJ7_9BACL|nr:DUF4178 domain-containing protein [Tumebacillus algifaecis]ASS74418.1 hypothetical protein CIG75_05065 [Tumebacillus algifaecis]
MGFFDKIKGIFGADKPKGLEQRTLVNLKVGDIISIDLTDYEVTGITIYRGGSKQRIGYLLNDAGRKCFLLVETKEVIRAFLYETIQARLANPEAVNYEMIYDGLSYFEKVRGESNVNVIGQSAFNTVDPVHWWMHVADSGQAMLIEWQNGETIFRIGAPIKADHITIFANN